LITDPGTVEKSGTSFPVTYVTSPFLEKLSPSASVSQVERDEFEDPNMIFPTDVH
jgi:hypothetical protein